MTRRDARADRRLMYGPNVVLRVRCGGRPFLAALGTVNGLVLLTGADRVVDQSARPGAGIAWDGTRWVDAFSRKPFDYGTARFLCRGHRRAVEHRVDLARIAERLVVRSATEVDLADVEGVAPPKSREW